MREQCINAVHFAHLRLIVHLTLQTAALLPHVFAVVLITTCICMNFIIKVQLLATTARK